MFSENTVIAEGTSRELLKSSKLFITLNKFFLKINEK